jgi:hypothetical protein
VLALPSLRFAQRYAPFGALRAKVQALKLLKNSRFLRFAQRYAQKPNLKVFVFKEQSLP